MFGTFLLELRHLYLDHPRVDPVPPYRRRPSVPAPLPTANPDTTPRTSRASRAAHSGRRQRRICKQPTNDNRSGSRPSAAAASAITDRTTKWPSDNAYNSCNTPSGVSLRKSRRLGHPPRILMRLLFVIDQFDFPTLMIQQHQLQRRVGRRLQQRREQHVFLRRGRRAADRSAYSG